MSRLGKKPVPIPDKVKVAVNGRQVQVDGPLGKLTRTLPDGIGAQLQDKAVLVTRRDDTTQQKSLHGTLRKILLNMVDGVSKGFTKELRIEGVGYRAQQTGNKISFALGFSHNKEFEVPSGIKVAIDAKQTGLTVQGADKQLVGQVAAEIRKLKPPEPYKGTGIRYADEHVRRKAGKAAVGATGGVGGAKK
ncbi:MAG TPA: 50S ribosomal protein L6 [Elusimicrobiota bacterium]|nr:50S ribosomal protein L6 [Elusimicrobiota bacterium]